MDGNRLREFKNLEMHEYSSINNAQISDSKAFPPNPMQYTQKLLSIHIHILHPLRISFILYRLGVPFFLLTAFAVPFSAVVLTLSRTSKSSAPELLAGVSSASTSESSSEVSFFFKNRLVRVSYAQTGTRTKAVSLTVG